MGLSKSQMWHQHSLLFMLAMAMKSMATSILPSVSIATIIIGLFNSLSRNSFILDHFAQLLKRAMHQLSLLKIEVQSLKLLELMIN